MTSANRSRQADDIERLRTRLAEAEETLRAIREGDVDALLIAHPSGDRLYTLQTADAPYRAFVEQMQEGAVTLSDEERITYCNRRFAALAGMPLERVIGAPVVQFFEQESDGQSLSNLLSRGSGALRTHLHQYGGPSREVHVSLATVSLDGQAQRTLIVSDMSAVVRFQRESREKDEFLAMLAHELRNPLGAIGGAAQVLGQIDLDDPHAVRARGVIERQVKHMSRLMDDLLDVGRVVTGKIGLECRQVDLEQTVRGCVAAAISSQPDERSIQVDTEPVWVNGDPVRLEQITGNLLSNALRFTGSDRLVRISVRAEGASAILRVVDEGVGIEPHLLSSIFDLFVQADRTRDRAKGGLGIGLTLVRRLVELHGGTIEASSAGTGTGSTFTVCLPRISIGDSIAAAPHDERAAAGRRVLLVDDNADSREMYALALETEGHEVFQSGDGPTALELFRRIRPQAAVIDIGLPGMDGLDLARHVRAEFGRDPLLIALTGYGFPEDLKRSRAAGFDTHLVKPVDPEELRRHLSTASAT